MSTFSCATDTLLVGESSCTKGILNNPSQMMLADENFAFTQAESNDVSFWTTNIKNKNVTLFPKIFSFEAAPIEAVYEETTFGARKSSQGNYGFRLNYAKNIEIHKNMFSFDGSLDRIILFDDQGKFMATLATADVDPALTTYKGMKPQIFSNENQTLEDGAATKSPIRIVFEEHAEWNVNGFIFLQSFLSQVKSLTPAILAEAVTPSIATLITASVTNNNDSTPIRGLLFDDFTYTGGTILDPAVEVSAGVYELSGVGLTTGDLDLVTAPNSSQFIESTGSISITI